MKDYTGVDLQFQTGRRRVKKKPVPTTVSFAHTAGELQTLEGPVPYKPGDALLTGSDGERWPVERDFFLRNYAPQPPAQAGADGLYIKCQIEMWALRVDEDFCVRLKHQKTLLQGGPGDWLVQYEAGEYGIVRTDIFAETYEERPLSGI